MFSGVQNFSHDGAADCIAYECMKLSANYSNATMPATNPPATSGRPILLAPPEVVTLLVDDNEPVELSELELACELAREEELDAELTPELFIDVTLDALPVAVCLEFKSPLPFRNCDRAEDSSMESEVADASISELEVGICRMAEEGSPDSPRNEYTVAGVCEEAISEAEACCSAAVVTKPTVLIEPFAELSCSFKGAHWATRASSKKVRPNTNFILLLLF